jgi:hypothetical protein
MKQYKSILVHTLMIYGQIGWGARLGLGKYPTNACLIFEVGFISESSAVSGRFFSLLKRFFLLSARSAQCPAGADFCSKYLNMGNKWK